MEQISHLIDNSGMLLTRSALQAGITKEHFYHFIEKHHFEKLSQGIYLSPDAWEDESFVLHRRSPQAVFSHDEALFYHGLTEHEPMQPTVTIYSGYNTKSLRNSGVKVFTVKKELLNIGRIEIVNSFGHTIPFYNLERTICDLFRNRSYFEIQDFQAAIRSYISRPDKDLNKLMSYAPLFRVEKLIRQYMEVLL